MPDRDPARDARSSLQIAVLPDRRLHFSSSVDPACNLSSLLLFVSLPRFSSHGSLSCLTFTPSLLSPCSTVARSARCYHRLLCSRSLTTLSTVLDVEREWSGILGSIEKGSRASVLPAQRAERATCAVAGTVARRSQPVWQLLRQPRRGLPSRHVTPVQRRS